MAAAVLMHPSTPPHPCPQVKAFKPTVARLFEPLRRALLRDVAPGLAGLAGSGGGAMDEEAGLHAALMEVYEWPDRHAALYNYAKALEAAETGVLGFYFKVSGGGVGWAWGQGSWVCRGRGRQRMPVASLCFTLPCPSSLPCAALLLGHQRDRQPSQGHHEAGSGGAQGGLRGAALPSAGRMQVLG